MSDARLVSDDSISGALGVEDVTQHLYGEHAVALKPLLMVAVREAVKLALIDSVHPPGRDAEGRGLVPTPDEKREWLLDPGKIPESYMATLDPDVLARNVGLRLLGTGGWIIGDTYTAHSSPAEVLDLCVQRPHQDPAGEMHVVLLDMGLRPSDEEPDG